MIAQRREGTLVFKDLIFPQWWLDWIIPLTSLAMLLQALELLVALCRTRRRPAMSRREHVPGIGREKCR